MKNRSCYLLAVLLSTAAGPIASAQTTTATTTTTTSTTSSTVVKMDPFSVSEGHDDPLQVISVGENSNSFGMGQSIYDTPRAITSISAEMMDRYNVTGIDDLTRISPGTFTSSFYGIAGQIDVRGTPGDTYFRDMKRIENPGNYPTPIAAADRVDIVRGPPSPVFGTGKVGGYLDFFPKSSRAETGLYLDQDTGILNATYGSWSKRVITTEVGGAGTIMGKKIGYYAYLMDEDSGSYYRNGFTNQDILQTTFDVDITPNLRVETGEQYQYWNGTENAGWNRVTQALIDHGTYLSGSPLLNLDTNGDGAISPAEATAAGGLSATSTYGGAPPKLGAQYALNPATVKLVHLGGEDVLIDKGDDALSKSFNYFFDTVDQINPDLKITNKIYTDYLDRDKHASYGFSQYQHAYSVEDRIIAEQDLQIAPWFKMENAYSLNYRYYNAIGASDSFFELAERRDLSVGGTPNDRTQLSWFRPDLNPWGSWVHSIYKDVGGAILTNMYFWDKFNVLLGGRTDYIDFYSQNAQNIRTGSGLKAYSFKKPIGYSGSLSYDLTPWFKPYVTYAQQPTPLIGQVGEVTVASIQANPLYSSTLREAGVKTELLQKKLFAAVDIYRQNRSSFDVLTNSITAYVAQGLETELRYVPTKELSFTGALTLQKTVYQPLAARTIFANPYVSGNDPASGYAGDERVTIPGTAFFAERPGEPDRIMSLYGTYLFDNGLGFTLGGVYTARVSAGASELVELPSSLVFTTSISYQINRWRFKLGIDNLTNVRYFHSLSPDSFGDFTVLPEPPRSANFSIMYRF